MEKLTKNYSQRQNIIKQLPFQIFQNTSQQILLKLKYFFIDQACSTTLQRKYQKGILNSIKSWNQGNIIILFSHTFELLKNISHINMSQVKHLNISFNQITSIEPISWMELRSIEILVLGNNKFNSLQPLTKTNFKKMSNLLLELNSSSKNNNNIAIDQIQKLTRTKYCAKPSKICQVPILIQLTLDLGRNIQAKSIVFKLQTRKAFNIKLETEGVSLKYEHTLMQMKSIT